MRNGSEVKLATGRGWRRLVLFLGLLALVAAGCGGGTDGEEVSSPTDTETTPTATEAGADEETETAGGEPVTIAVGFNGFWSLPPLFVGRELGYFDELEGVTVQWEEFESPPAAIAAMAAGDIQAAAAPGPVILQARAQGIDVVAVASLAGESDPAQYGFITRADSGVDDVSDLEGKTIGVNNFGGNFDLHARYLLEQEGLDPDTDAQFTVTPLATVVPAVLEGSVDTGAVVGAGMLIAEQNPDLAIVFDSRDVGPIRGTYSFMNLAMTTRFIEDNRAAAVEFLTAYARAVDYILENPEESAELWATNTGVEIMANLRGMNEFPDGGHVQTEGLEFDLELLTRYAYIDAEVDLAAAVDRSLLEEARSQ